MQQFACEKAGQAPQALLVFDLLDNLFTNPDNEIPKENHWEQITPDKYGKIYHFLVPSMPIHTSAPAKYSCHTNQPSDCVDNWVTMWNDQHGEQADSQAHSRCKYAYKHFHPPDLIEKVGLAPHKLACLIC
tara:strand:+ start:16514 stop:16906 length:393 start_codon:yes stop_codon:yes gene_type:complete